MGQHERVEIRPVVDQHWFIQKQHGNQTEEDVENERRYWEKISGFKTSIVFTESHIKFMFDATKPVKNERK